MGIEKKYVWFSAIGLGIVLIVAVFLVGAPKYKAWQADRMIKSAQIALQKEAYLDASLNLRHVLDLFPNHLQAHALLAELCEKVNDPSAVLWRKRISEICPGDSDAVIAYAAVAIRFNQRAAAQEALNRVPPAERENVSFHQASGALAYSTKDFDKAIYHFQRAIELAPEDVNLKLTLATAQIAVPDYKTREAGRASLAQLGASGTQQIPALRALISSYLATSENFAALRYTKQLVQLPGHTMADDLQHLKLLRNADEPNFRKFLDQLKEQSLKDPKRARDLVAWMAENGHASEGIEWVTVTQPELSKIDEIRPALAACYVVSEKWNDVLSITQDSDWGSLEYVRHVYRSRALRQKGELSLAVSDWKIAAAAAASRPEAILWLAQTAAKWNWQEEMEDALWTAVEKGADLQWALETLRARYAIAQDSNGLRRVAAHLLQLNPDDDEAQNGYASLSLLVGKETERSSRIARDLFVRHPDNPEYSSTYAFALFLMGDNEQAKSIFEKYISAAKLAEPAYAAYYGAILVANGDLEKARTYLSTARGGRLLPEERKLVQDAWVQLPKSVASAENDASPERN